NCRSIARSCRPGNWCIIYKPAVTPSPTLAPVGGGGCESAGGTGTLHVDPPDAPAGKRRGTSAHRGAGAGRGGDDEATGSDRVRDVGRRHGGSWRPEEVRTGQLALPLPERGDPAVQAR